jgi:hypothetical protein
MLTCSVADILRMLPRSAWRRAGGGGAKDMKPLTGPGLEALQYCLRFVSHNIIIDIFHDQRILFALD